MRFGKRIYEISGVVLPSPTPAFVGSSGTMTTFVRDIATILARVSIANCSRSEFLLTLLDRHRTMGKAVFWSIGLCLEPQQKQEPASRVYHRITFNTDQRGKSTYRTPNLETTRHNTVQ